MATTQVQRRLSGSVLAAVAAGLAIGIAAADARAGGNWMPLLPDQDFYDFQIFAPPDLGDYQIYPETPEGFFFNYDRVYWSITAPLVAPVGNQNFWPIEILSPTVFPDLQDPNPNDQVREVVATPVVVYPFGTGPSNFNLDTSWLTSRMAWGNRFEGGWVYDDWGLMLSGFVTQPQSQSLTTRNSFGASTPNITQGTTPVQITTVVPGITPVVVQNTVNYLYYIYNNTPPNHLIEQEFTQSNKASLSSFEIDFLRRAQFSRNRWDRVDVSLGVRYFQLQDEFEIGYRSFATQLFPPPVQSPGLPPQNLRSPLQTAAWRTLSSNNLVGPQIGLSGRGRMGRWTLGYDLKFAAEMNFVNNVQRGSRLNSNAAADYFRGTVPVNGPAVQFPPNQLGQTGAPNVVNFPPIGLVAVQNYSTANENQATQRRNTAVFAPLGEWRLETTFQATRAISLHLGYSGMWLGGISRASRTTTYQHDQVVTGYTPAGTPIINGYDQFGLARGNQYDYLFVNGADFGVEFNY